MIDPVKSKIEILEALLRDLTDAAYLTLCASNGVSDNEWTTPDGTAIPEWPLTGYRSALDKLNITWENAQAYFEPAEAEKHRKWADACATASYIMDRLKEDRETRQPNMTDSSLHRNIADAINGTLVQTVADRVAGTRPETMIDRLNTLVEKGSLVEWKPDDGT